MQLTGTPLITDAAPYGIISFELAGSVTKIEKILAGLMDIVENVALVKIIFGTVASPWPEIALWSAILKFSLIIFGLVFIIYGSVLYITVLRNRNTE